MVPLKDHRIVALAAQVLRFGIVGVISTLVDYVGYLLLDYGLGVHYLVASTLSYSLGIVVNYWLSMRYVFASDESRSKRREFAIFVTLTLIGLVLNQIFLYVFVEWLGLSGALAKILATILVMVYSFVSRKIFIEPSPAHTPKG